MKLHIGCGSRNFGEDWIHIDGSSENIGGDDRIKGSFEHIKYHDITKLPFNNAAVDLIYSSHTFEYFDRDECINILNEWIRVLKKGGVIRLAVPDFEAMANLYVTDNISLDRFIGPLYGKWKMTDNLTVYHKTVYDFKSLKKVLENAGLQDIRNWDWINVEHGHIDDYSQSYIPHMDKQNGTLVSLNIEGTKI